MAVLPTASPSSSPPAWFFGGGWRKDPSSCPSAQKPPSTPCTPRPPQSRTCRARGTSGGTFSRRCPEVEARHPHRDSPGHAAGKVGGARATTRSRHCNCQADHRSRTASNACWSASTKTSPFHNLQFTSPPVRSHRSTPVKQTAASAFRATCRTRLASEMLLQMTIGPCPCRVHVHCPLVRPMGGDRGHVLVVQWIVSGVSCNCRRDEKPTISPARGSPWEWWQKVASQDQTGARAPVWGSPYPSLRPALVLLGTML